MTYREPRLPAGPPDEDIANWSDERIWDELDVRLGMPGWSLERGEAFDKGADFALLRKGLVDHYERGDDTVLDGYSETQISRSWQTQYFST